MTEQQGAGPEPAHELASATQIGAGVLPAFDDHHPPPTGVELGPHRPAVRQNRKVVSPRR